LVVNGLAERQMPGGDVVSSALQLLSIYKYGFHLNDFRLFSQISLTKTRKGAAQYFELQRPHNPELRLCCLRLRGETGRLVNREGLLVHLVDAGRQEQKHVDVQSRHLMTCRSNFTARCIWADGGGRPKHGDGR